MATTATLNPAHALRERFRSWIDSRQPRTDTLLLTQRNVYILPTKAGVVKFSSYATVGDTTVVSADLMCTMRRIS